MLPTVNGWSDRLRRLAFGLASAILIVLLASPHALALNDAQQLVVESWRLVNQGYLDPEQFDRIRWKRLRQKALENTIESSEEAYSAIETMLLPLNDPYTRLLRPADYEVMKASNEGNLSGVGLQLGHRQDSTATVVIAPLEGSPAADAGIVSGTEVLAVNGESVETLGLETTAARLRGAVGSQVVLTVLPPQEVQQQEITLERRNIDLRPVRTRRLRSDTHTLGYIRITQFSEGVPEQVRAAIDELSDKSVEGLVLDLRNNSGGLVSAGLAVADAFLNQQPIVETRNRSGIADPIQAGPEVLYSGPMVTLVNGGTASASEILAGALQDDERSLLLGSNTFGKGLIQTLTNLSDGSGLAVTVAGYVTPSGRDIQGEGITPDRILDGPEPLNPGGEGDRWLTDAELVLQSMIDQEASQASADPMPITDEIEAEPMS
ncbi:carboxy-terminal processing peptidase [Synechococcus sp. BIOS-E4-1]|uniref:carboxyl-terminal processing protease CtpZ n=1 Tax=Synechococcus sp. BIOS-E4-1 TaxID=1400864 RepID=UPI001648F40E|nr:carboxyl-terminal processing protease CtpZ [Synechococcus sp. BIOS-E4-1]QNI53207.1 carboxy-terminal processing peptidase [Synechococcus sp. BIOS-E4-1]